MTPPTDSPLAADPAPLALPSDRDASGRDLGAREIELLAEVVQTGHLNSTGGTFVPRLSREFAARHGVPHAIACASGSAAVHAALGALGLRSGDEVVTTPITDIGAVLPIVYEGATPVFADVDLDTLNVTADTLEAAVTERTRAVIVTHLFGQPCRMEPILALAARRGIVVIEDAAQAFLATESGRLCGTIGALGCFVMMFQMQPLYAVLAFMAMGVIYREEGSPSFDQAFWSGHATGGKRTAKVATALRKGYVWTKKAG